MKKKIFVVMAAVFMVFSLFGCSKNKQADQPAGPQYTVILLNFPTSITDVKA